MSTVVEPSTVRLSILNRIRALVWPGEIPAGSPSGGLEVATCQGIWCRYLKTVSLGRLASYVYRAAMSTCLVWRGSV